MADEPKNGDGDKEANGEQPKREPCTACGETFDPAKDPYHRENCREANKP